MNLSCIQCQMSNDWECVGVHDNPRTGYAYNLYLCSCGTILKQSVWKGRGNLWILENGEVIIEQQSEV